MKIPVWYCEKFIDLELPESLQVDLFDIPAKRMTAVDKTHWLNSSTAPEGFAEFLTKCERLLVIVNDCYRPTPTARILRSLADNLDPDKTRFLVATGLHDAPSPHDIVKIFGDSFHQFRNHVFLHSAFDESQLQSFGEGESSVKLNRLFDWCDSILTVGSVEPHYFAGFTGGRKIVLPGCASFEDVRMNHALALKSECQPLKTVGNPVWEDIQKRTWFLNSKLRYSIQVVCGHTGETFFAAAGDWDATYQNAARFVVENFAHRVTAPYDAVISVVYPPLDRNLYQLQKSYENVKEGVRDGGTVLLISGCRDGVGDDRFLKIARNEATEGSSGSSDEASVMGIHKVGRTRDLVKRIELMLVSTLAGSEFDCLPIRPMSTIAEAIAELIKKYGNNCKIAVVLDSATQVLYTQPFNAARTATTEEEKTHA